MRWLIGCERSGVVRRAFRARGHEAYSCDLEPSEDGGEHLQGDVLEILERRGPFDGFIVHPPCTYTSASGLHWNRRRPERVALTEAALEFARRCFDAGAKVPRFALENPIGAVSTRIRKPTQTVQPWQFGENASKATCLWLERLPPLRPTRIVEPRYSCACGTIFEFARGIEGCPSCGGERKVRPIWANQTPSGQNKLGPSPTRGMDRSRTYPGIADAMAEQWGNA